MITVSTKVPLQCGSRSPSMASIQSCCLRLFLRGLVRVIEGQDRG